MASIALRGGFANLEEPPPDPSSMGVEASRTGIPKVNFSDCNRYRCLGPEMAVQTIRFRPKASRIELFFWYRRPFLSAFHFFMRNRKKVEAITTVTSYRQFISEVVHPLNSACSEWVSVGSLIAAVMNF
jgi:hypothetical protein